MKSLTMVVNKYGGTNLAALIVCLALGLACLSVPVSAQNNADDGQSAAEAEALKNYATATAAGRHAAAVKYFLDYMEKTEGENAPRTVALTQSYGNLLRKEGNIREAISVLKTARKRGIIAFGEHGIELFTINLDLGEAYVDRHIGVYRPQKYFDDALEVLRENGQRETTLYVTTLVGIASRLTQAGALDGALSADTGGVELSNLGGTIFESLLESGVSSVTHSYQSGYGVPERYLREAVELAEALENEDPYLSAKIAIVQAKIRVIETLFLEVVPPTVQGSVSGATTREMYQRQDDHLSSAIDVLMADAVQNQGFLDIANSARMEISWLSEDMERLANFCSSNTLNMASRYTPDRLFEIEADGSVIAPRLSFSISSNIFRRLPARQLPARETKSLNPNREPNKSPRFVPVCINGHLMAALINVPRVTIEEIRR
jgi:hypothetical protein